MNDLLLVIDMQNVYLPDQPWACETVAHTKANILKLLEKHPKNQTIFTRYIAAEHPVGTWKTYNELNRKINEDPWMNELMDGIKEAAETTSSTTKAHIPPFRYPPSVRLPEKPTASSSPALSPNAVSYPLSLKASTSAANSSGSPMPPPA